MCVGWDEAMVGRLQPMILEALRTILSSSCLYWLVALPYQTRRESDGSYRFFLVGKEPHLTVAEHQVLGCPGGLLFVGVAAHHPVPRRAPWVWKRRQAGVGSERSGANQHILDQHLESFRGILSCFLEPQNHIISYIICGSVDQNHSRGGEC